MLTWRNDNVSTRWTFIYAEVLLVIDHLEKNPQKKYCVGAFKPFFLCQTSNWCGGFYSLESLWCGSKAHISAWWERRLVLEAKKISSSSFIFICLFTGNIKNCEMFDMLGEAGWKKKLEFCGDVAVGNKYWNFLKVELLMREWWDLKCWIGITWSAFGKVDQLLNTNVGVVWCSPKTFNEILEGTVTFFETFSGELSINPGNLEKCLKISEACHIFWHLLEFSSISGMDKC